MIGNYLRITQNPLDLIYHLYFWSYSRRKRSHFFPVQILFRKSRSEILKLFPFKQNTTLGISKTLTFCQLELVQSTENVQKSLKTLKRTCSWRPELQLAVSKVASGPPGAISQWEICAHFRLVARVPAWPGHASEGTEFTGWSQTQFSAFCFFTTDGSI